MRLEYHEDVDVIDLYLVEGNYPYYTSISKDSIVFDFNEQGNLIGIEILDASDKFSKKEIIRMLSK